MQTQNKGVKEISEKNWESEVLQSQEPVLVDFWASWCGPCKMLSPTLEQIAKEQKFGIKIVKVNVDQNSSLASSNGVQSIPTLKIFNKGKVVKTTIEAQSKASLEKMISDSIDS
jgi:thioredoxin 1